MKSLMAAIVLLCVSSTVLEQIPVEFTYNLRA